MTSQLGWYERQELTQSSKTMDRIAWFSAYRHGYRKPNFPLPVKYHVSLDPDCYDTMSILANVLFHADSIFYRH